MIEHRLTCSLVVLWAALSAGCATTLTPIHPSTQIEAGEPVVGVRFEPEHIEFREPAMPVSAGRIWKREVASFTATQLNEMLSTSPGEDKAQTVVTFEMHGPSMIQIGAWKEMTVSLSTTLPDGRVIHTGPTSEYLDSNLEFGVDKALTFAGPILNIASFALFVWFLATPGGLFSNPFSCGCLAAVAMSGLALNGLQALSQIAFSILEERRWSDLYLATLRQHADDVRDVIHGKRQPAALEKGGQPASAVERVRRSHRHHRLWIPPMTRSHRVRRSRRSYTTCVISDASVRSLRRLRRRRERHPRARSLARTST